MSSDPFSVQQDFTAARVVNAVDTIEHRGFAGPIRTDQRDQFGWRCLERDRPQSLDSSEAESDVFDYKSGACFLHPHHLRLRAYWRTLRELPAFRSPR